MTGLCFANNEKSKIENSVKESKQIKHQVILNDDNCFTVTYSCGKTEEICDFEGDFWDLMAYIEKQENKLCPFAPL